ncbi:S-layer homology domain-containing protein [Anaeropeptidivorans aminofermentans]|uniref:S-layer homology domain-containing protein n=1 Tax=Anaeropeptidivorans aminofermentans TaxID=2934315 RepID=UPI0020246DB8|nr:S-layer homology domain-containing protein [Anaeropeptidivorans aminofermentans]
MSKRKPIQRLTAVALSVIMVVGMMPVSAAAAGMPIGASGEITAFEALGSDITVRSVPLGTSKADLELPDTLTATIRLAVLDEEPVLDSGETDAKLDSADTVSGSAIGMDEKVDTEAGAEAEIASPSDAQETKSDTKAEPVEKTVDSIDEISVPLPVTWTSSPEYDGEVAGTYHFTPELPEGFTLAAGAKEPQITVTVGAAVITGGMVTAFDELPDDIRWQNTIAPTFPETVSGTVGSEAAQIPVTWEADHDYDAEYPQRGLYVFTVVLGEGYALADGVELPRITVYIPQSAGRMLRMTGGGTTDSPLEITTAAQLAEIATLVNARENGLELFLFNDAGAKVSLKLMNDLNLSAYSSGEGWMPIGTSEFPFTGSFDGNDKSILGLYINRNVDYQGLFGYVGNEGAVKSLGVINVNITGRINVGSVAGWVRGTVQDCYSTGNVTGSSYVGGAAGEVDGGTLENCYNTGSVTGTGSGTSGSVGGVAGWVSGTVQNCYSTGNVTGTGVGISTGGVAGWVTNTGIIQNCFNTGSITASGTDTGNKICAGGVAGWVYGTVQNCYSTGSITGTGTSAYVGGVAGTVSGTVKSCAALNSSISAVGYNVGVGRAAGIDTRNRLSGNMAYSGMTVNGVMVSSTDTDSINGMNVDASAIQTLWTTGALSDWDSSIWTLSEGKLPGFGTAIDMPEYIVDGSDPNFFGEGTSETPYQITTPAQLAKLAELVNEGNASYNAAHYRLMNDLDLSGYVSGEGWMPIGNAYSRSFNGTFDGNGNTIANLTINAVGGDYQGLFGKIVGGVVKDLGVAGVSINGRRYVGGVAGAIESATLENCYSTGNINSTANGSVGGIVGAACDNNMVKYCYSTCDVNSTGESLSQDRGGVVGLLCRGSMLQNCYSTGNVMRTGSTGYHSGSAGGVVGEVAGAIVENCYSTGNVSGAEITGGVVGSMDGDSALLRNCYGTGSVSDSYKAGGVAGQVKGGATVENCAALNPSVSGRGYVERVLTLYEEQGILSGNLAFDGVEVLKNTAPQSITSNANGVDGLSKTAAQIYTADFWTQAAGFTADWDTDIWHIESGKLPLLKNMGGQHAYMPEHLLPVGASVFEGAGTSASPYLIKTAADLAKLAELVNAGTSPYADPGRYYRLEKDLDLSSYASGEGWMPIGTSAKQFKGNFNGNNKTITGLTITRSTADYIGLFGYLYIGSKVQNIRIIDASVNGQNSVGGIAGFAWDAAVGNCAVIGNVSGDENVGGTVGRASSGTVQNCYSTGSVTGKDYVGGIIGYLEYAATTVQRCYSDSSVSGVRYVGGVAGDVSSSSVQNCYSTGNIKGVRYVGGVAGSVTSGSVQNCAALNPSINNASASDFGRVVGRNTSGSLLNNYAFSRIPGTWANKGLSAKDGADVTSQTLFGGRFWTTAGNWDTAAWDSGVWTFADGKLPTLTGLAGQSGDGGLYLTARDIQYATVGATDGLTYNGSEQIPALIFDGETLVKDTDYTVAVADESASDGTNAGTVTLTITGIGSFYGTINITYTIGKKPITIMPHPGQSKKYGEIDPILTFANGAGLAPGAFTGKLSRAAGENVGTYAISLGNLSAGGNYEISLAPVTVNFTIEQAKVSEITTTVDNANKTAYEMRTATTAQAVVDAAGLPSSVNVSTDGGTAVLPITWSTVSAYNAKTAIYVVVGTLTGNSNIEPNGVTASLTVTVTPVTAVPPTFSDTLVVISSDSSATAAELGSAILPASGSIMVEGQSVAYTVDWNGGEALDRTAVGTEQTFTGTISYITPPAWLTLPDSSTVSRKVSVTAKQAVIIGGITTANKAYDGASYAPSGTATVTGGSVPVNQLEWLYESTDSAGYRNSTAPTNAGAYKLTISVPESNPDYAGSEIFNFTIAKREITLVTDNKTVTKGGSLPELTYTVGNLAPGETKADALSTQPVLACPTFDGNTVGSYPITLTGGTATDNYTITTRTNGTLTVAEQTYTVTFNLNGGSRTGGGELSQTIAEGGAATAPTATRSGYTFTGWDKAFDNVTADLTVTASWSYNGSGGSGGGDSYTPGTPTITTPEKKPDQPVTATAPITAAGQNGAASASIPDKTVTDAIAKAQADAKAQGKTANGISVALNVTMPKGTTSLAATLTRNSLNSLVSAGVTELEISGAPVSLSLDLNALKEIQKQSSGDISISFTPVTGLSKAAKALLGNRPVYSITISYTDKHGKTQNISSLGSGKATLSIPYTPGKNEAVGYLFGVYVDGAGNATRIPGSAYDPNSRSLLLGTNHFSVYGVGYEAPSAKFTDISTHWGKESIDYVVGRGLLSGTSKTTFAPDTAMTREMLVTALGRLTGVDVKAYTTNSFTDVKAGSTFRPYIEWAYKKGIVQGIGNQQFAPDRAITREEVAVIFANYAKATGYKLPVTREAVTYADASSIGSIYKAAVTAMQQAGIMMGETNNRFNPKSNATRAEVSAMLHRYIKLTIDPDTAQGWALNDAGQYLYYKDGKALTGTQTIDGVKYFFNTDGTLKTGWVKDGGNWRYYTGNKVAVDWLDISDKRYYFTKDGVMVSGKWLEIDGKWYYCNADGSLAKNTKVDGYEVDKNGVRKTK